MNHPKCSAPMTAPSPFTNPRRPPPCSPKHLFFIRVHGLIATVVVPRKDSHVMLATEKLGFDPTRRLTPLAAFLT